MPLRVKTSRMNRLTRSPHLSQLRRSSGGAKAGSSKVVPLLGVGAVGGGGYYYYTEQKRQEREAKVEQWRAKQAKLAAAREAQEQAAAVEEAVVVEEIPVTEVVEVAQEVEETPPVAEEVKEERPERDFESFVEDVVDPPSEEAQTVEIVEPVEEVSTELAEPVVEATVEEVAEVVEVAETVEDVAEVVEVAEPAPSEAESVEQAADAEPAVEVEIIDPELQVGQASRIAAQTTDEIIVALDKATATVLDYVKAKRYAFSFVGDTERRVAVWLQVNEYANEMNKCTEELNQASGASEDALEQLNALLAKIDTDVVFGLDTEAQAMRQKIAEHRAQYDQANECLGRLNEIEQRAEEALQEHRESLKSIVGDVAEDDLWRSLNPKFSQDDLRGLIFLAQKKIQTYKEEIQTLSNNFDQLKADALRDQEDKLNQQTQERINLLEAEYEARLNQRRDEIKEQMREEYEMDLELQLKRQASAHSMHLADELTNKESQITQIFNQRIQDQIDTLTSQYTDQLAKERNEINDQIKQHEELTLKASAFLRGQMDGITTTLEERIKTESQVTGLQTLLVGVENLTRAVECDSRVPLDSIVSDLKRITSESPFLHPVLESLPTNAVDKGVVSPGVLRSSFAELKQSAFDNHLINAEANGLLISQWSKLCSMVGFGKPLAELSELVKNAEGYMLADDFESAVRVLNKTSGEPKRIFTSWMEEARLMLEVRQAMEALNALSEARILSSRCLS